LSERKIGAASLSLQQVRIPGNVNRASAYRSADKKAPLRVLFLRIFQDPGGDAFFILKNPYFYSTIKATSAGRRTLGAASPVAGASRTGKRI
ncbi:MAG: hypothetical protein II771_05615, partial [Clostridia bacterium]|nr:hypothetical protein [Clostridia bacterium]